MSDSESLTQQHLTEHLAELRSCLIVSFSAVMLGFVVAWYFIQPIADRFLAPLVKVLPNNESLIFTSYQEGFFFI